MKSADYPQEAPLRISIPKMRVEAAEKSRMKNLEMCLENDLKASLFGPAFMMNWPDASTNSA
jgi:hypothetical protein